MKSVQAAVSPWQQELNFICRHRVMASSLEPMVGALLLYFVCIAGGTLLTYLFDRGTDYFSARLATGTILGLSLLASLGFVASLLLGLTTESLVIAAVLIACASAVLIDRNVRTIASSELSGAFEKSREFLLRGAPSDRAFVLVFSLGLIAFLWEVFSRVLIADGSGLSTGFVNNLGDLPFHLQAISSFAQGNNFPPEDPVFAGAPFTYSFMADFLSAILLHSGFSFRYSLFLPNLLLILSFLILLHRWTVELTGNRLAGFLAPAFVIFSGGLGWVLLVGEIPHRITEALHYALNLPHDFTILPGHTWRWGNSLTTLFVPQRSILFGLPMAVCVFTQWWMAQRDFAFSGEQSTVFSQEAIRRQIAAGMITGLLPLVHAHIFLSVMGMAACAAVISWRWRLWLAFFIPALVIASPELLWLAFAAGARARSFVALHIGWDHGDTNFWWFWFLNTGLFIPMLLAALFWRVRGQYLVRRELARFYAPFALCFIVPNVIRLAPWEWDNIKVLFLWFVGSTPLVALLLAHWLRQRWEWRVLASGVLCTLTLAGALDLSRVIRHTVVLPEFSNDGIAIAQEIVKHTDPRALVLHAPTYDTPVFLTGRRSLLGYPGQIWSRGLDAGSRESDIRSIYAGASNGRALLESYAVNNILVGPQERGMMVVNSAFFSNFTLIGKSGEYSLYQIKKK
jgi:hypothetical protein